MSSIQNVLKASKLALELPKNRLALQPQTHFTSTISKVYAQPQNLMPSVQTDICDYLPSSPAEDLIHQSPFSLDMPQPHVHCASAQSMSQDYEYHTSPLSHDVPQLYGCPTLQPHNMHPSLPPSQTMPQHHGYPSSPMSPPSLYCSSSPPFQVMPQHHGYPSSPMSQGYPSSPPSQVMPHHGYPFSLPSDDTPQTFISSSLPISQGTSQPHLYPSSTSQSITSDPYVYPHLSPFQTEPQHAPPTHGHPPSLPQVTAFHTNDHPLASSSLQAIPQPPPNQHIPQPPPHQPIPQLITPHDLLSSATLQECCGITTTGVTLTGHFVCKNYFGCEAPRIKDLCTAVVDRATGNRFNLKNHISDCWKTIGLTLGMELSLLNSIERNRFDDAERLMTVFGHWLENAAGLPNHAYYPLSWQGLNTLLEDMGKVEVAKRYFEFLEVIHSNPMNNE